MPKSPRYDAPQQPQRRPDRPRPNREDPSGGGSCGEGTYVPMPPPLGDAARDLAVRRLARQAARFPEMEIVGLDDAHAAMRALTDLDAAFVHAIYDAAVRRWMTLSWLLGKYSSQPFADLEPRMQGALMAAAAQLVLLDRVPPHAAINHAVEWCKQVIRPGAGSMANAILRKFATLVRAGDPDRPRRAVWTDQPDELPMHDGSAFVLAEAVLPMEPLHRLAVVTSHPVELLQSWSLRLGPDEVRRLALHGLTSPPVILNVMHSQGGREGAGPPLEAQFTIPHTRKGHAVFTHPRGLVRSALEGRRDIWVQDPAASAAVLSIADLPLAGGLIMDLCAGQGTKTRQLAAVFPNTRIVASDVDEARRLVLESVFQGSQQVAVVSPKQLRRDYIEKADLILLDVPCSNTGVLARRPEAKYRYTADSLASVTNLQRQIIADSIPLLSVTGGGGGRGARRGQILYSTCSMEPDENERMAEWATTWHGFVRQREHRQSPQGGPGLPTDQYCDGAYSVLLA